MAYTVWLKSEIINIPIEHATISDYKVGTTSLTMFKIDGRIKKTKQIFKEEENHWNMVPTEEITYEPISLIVNKYEIAKIKEE